jgi:alpha-beta hydrolase superfamily lysophospholipase
MTRKSATWMGIALVIVVLVAAYGPSMTLRYFEAKFLSTGPNGPETPASVGLAYERVNIPSNGRTLDGYFVPAAAACQPKVAVLIFHGIMETISEWVPGQKFLCDHCVTSLVFDYSGHGDSSRPGTVKNLNQDAVAAYSWFAARFGNETRLCVLGHSMGNGPMTEGLAMFQPPPACVVVANAFSSLRDAGMHRGTPRIFVYMTPDMWNSVKNISSARAPVLVIGSDADTVNPIGMGERIFAAAPVPKQMIVVHGFKHNALYQSPSEEWWGPVLEFLRDEKGSS